MVKLIRRVSALLLTLIIIVLLPVAVWVLASYIMLSNPDTIKNGLRQEDIYAELGRVALPALASAATEGVENTDVTFLDVINVVSNDDPAAWSIIADRLIPEDWLQRQVEGLIDIVYSFASGDEITFDYDQELQLLRSRLTGSIGEANARLIYESLPDCNVRQTAQLREAADGNGEPPLCQSLRPQYSALVTQTILRTMDAIVPESPNDDVQSLVDLEIEASLALIGSGFSIYLQATIILFLICGALLGLIIALVVRSLKGFGLWGGWIAIISGFVTLIPLLVLPITLLDGIDALLTPSNPSSNPELQRFINRVIASITTSAYEQTIAPVLLQIGVLLGIGVILLILSSIAPTYQITQPSTVAYPPINTPPPTATGSMSRS